MVSVPDKVCPFCGELCYGSKCLDCIMSGKKKKLEETFI